MEMCRALDGLHYEANKWQKIGNAIPPWPNLASTAVNTNTLAMAEGRRAYALERANIYNALARRWASKWTPVVQSAKQTPFASSVRDLGDRACWTKDPVIIDVRNEHSSEDIDEDAAGAIDADVVAANKAYI
jgi:hypothetical protein